MCSTVVAVGGWWQWQDFVSHHMTTKSYVLTLGSVSESRHFDSVSHDEVCCSVCLQLTDFTLTREKCAACACMCVCVGELLTWHKKPTVSFHPISRVAFDLRLAATKILYNLQRWKRSKWRAPYSASMASCSCSFSDTARVTYFHKNLAGYCRRILLSGCVLKQRSSLTNKNI